MSLTDEFRAIVREELDRRDERIAQRVADLMRADMKSTDRLLGKAHFPIHGYAWETVKRMIGTGEGKLRRFGTARKALVSERELLTLLAHNNAPKGDPTAAEIHDLAVERANRR